MYESIRIQNFRGLKDLTIENLGRVNLLVGANNVGKTSVLEAIYLLGNAGDPTAGLKLAAARGVNASASNAEEVWLGLFGDVGTTAELFGQLSEGPLWVDIKLRRPDDGEDLPLLQLNGEIAAPEVGPRIAAARSLILVTEMRREGLEPEIATAFVDTTGNLSGRYFVSPSWPRTVFVPSTGVVDESDVAEGLSQAEEKGLVNDLVGALRDLIPEVIDLRVALRRSDGKPFIRVHLENGEKRPLYLFGAGAVRLLGAILATANNRAGAVLIDEIDSGIYHSRLRQTWLSLASAARGSGMMVVATTHSQECVVAAIEAFAETPDDFRLHRISTRRHGLRVTTYDYEAAEASVELRIEVR